MPVTAKLAQTAQRAAEAVLSAQGFGEQVDLSITFVEDTAIRELNRRYRGKDEPTDVLSFSMNEEVQENGGKVLLLGDVVISLETAARWAESAGHDLTTEVVQLAVHGTLHLLGFDHRTDEEAAQMSALEREIINSLGVPYAALWHNEI